jgi:hypothetical protein
MQKFAAILCAALVTPSFATTHKVPPDEPIATVQIPENWRTKPLGENVEASSPDGGVSFLVTPVERKKVAESMGEVMRYLRNRDGITVSADSIKNEQGKLNGIETKTVSWQGKNKKGDVEIRFIILSLAENETLIAAYWGSPEAAKKHQAELNEMLRSIKQP